MRICIAEDVSDLLAVIPPTTLETHLEVSHDNVMTKLHMVTFRCSTELFERLEKFAVERDIDRTSVLKLAVHYYLNCHHCA